MLGYLALAKGEDGRRLLGPLGTIDLTRVRHHDRGVPNAIHELELATSKALRKSLSDDVHDRLTSIVVFGESKTLPVSH